MWVAKSSASFALLLVIVLVAFAAGNRKEVLVPVEGETLAALYFDPPEDLSAAVLLVPGAESNKEGWIPLAERLRQRGYGVLAIDLRANGAADEGRAQVDVAAGFAFLRDQKRVDAARLAVVGAGLGANSALAFSAREATVRALVLLSPVESDRKGSAEAAMAYYGSRPVLLAAGQGQGYGERAERLARRARGPKVVELHDGESQGEELLEAMPDLERALLDFLDEQLRPRS